MCGEGSFRTLSAYALESSFIPRAVFIGYNLPKELIALVSNLCVFEERIRYVIKYQALNIESHWLSTHDINRTSCTLSKYGSFLKITENSTRQKMKFKIFLSRVGI